MEQHENLIKLQGKVYSKSGGPNFENVILETTISKDGKRNVLHLVAFGDIAMKIRKKVKRDGWYSFVGHLAPYEEKGTDGKKYLTQDVVIDSFERAQSRMEGFGGDTDIGSGTYSRINEGTLSGTVKWTKRQGTRFSLVLQVATKGYINEVLVVMYDDKNNEYLDKIKEGENIQVAGEIHSSVRSSKARGQYHEEEFIVYEMGKVKK